MTNIIRPRRSATTGQEVPAAGAEAAGEILVNTTDRKVFVRTSDGSPVQVAARVLPYSADRAYDLDDLTVESGMLWICTTPVTAPEAFDDDKWEALGGSLALEPAVIKAPGASDRNEIEPTGDFTALSIAPAGGQSVPLLDINGTMHDARGLPIGRYGEVVFLVSQTAHPFTFRGQPAAYTHPNWVLAQANNASLICRAIVHEVIDANNVLLQVGGRIRSLQTGAFAGGSISAGATYYVGTTAGQLTSTPPTSPQPVLVATSSSAGNLTVTMAGAAITSRPPGALQVIHGQVSVRSSDSSTGITINPGTKTISSVGGSAINLIMQPDGTFRIEAPTEIAGTLNLNGIFRMSHAEVPQIIFQEGDQTAPAGHFRWVVNDDSMHLQRSSNADGTFTSTPPINLLRSNTAAEGLRVFTPLTVDGNAAFASGIAALGNLTVGGNAVIAGMLNVPQGGTPSANALIAHPDVISGSPTPQLRIRFSGSGGTTGSLVLTQADSQWLSLSPGNRRIDASGAITINQLTQVLGAVQAAGSVEASSSENSGFRLTDNPGGSLRGTLYARGAGGGGGITLQARTGGTTNARLDLRDNGAWVMVDGFWTGIGFGAAVASSRQDLSRHLNLYGGAYGISVTGDAMNLVASGPSSFVFVVGQGGTVRARFDDAGVGLGVATSVVTREKGDNRYRLSSQAVPLSDTSGDLPASRINGNLPISQTSGNLPVARLAGTIPVAQLPTSQAELARILGLLAGTPLNAVGSIAMIRIGANDGPRNPGQTVAGSLCYFSHANGINDSSPVPLGTWRVHGAMGSGGAQASSATVCQRIS